jgi:large subunit ribosomal protein L18
MKRTRIEAARRRHQRARGRIRGNPERPRLCVHKSLRHLYVQIVDDTAGRTLCSATTNTKQDKAEGRKTFSNKVAAKQLGETIGRLAVEKGIKQVVFDRGGNRYHGCVRELAEAARAAGVKF